MAARYAVGLGLLWSTVSGQGRASALLLALGTTGPQGKAARLADNFPASRTTPAGTCFPKKPLWILCPERALRNLDSPREQRLELPRIVLQVYTADPDCASWKSSSDVRLRAHGCSPPRPLCITFRGIVLSLIRAKQSLVLHGRHCVGMLGAAHPPAGKLKDKQ